jgi:hypothetical protein
VPPATVRVLPSTIQGLLATVRVPPSTIQVSPSTVRVPSSIASQGAVDIAAQS